MNTKNQTLKKLHSELSKFGLNPSEWTLEYVESLRYLIRHNLDESFALYGRLEFKNQKPTWKSIDLMTL
jgi:hypothetical protein